MDDNTSLLLTLQANSFKLNKRKKNSFKLVLNRPGEGILFGDRPARNATRLSIASIAENWEEAFQDDPPNAVLSSTEGPQPFSGVFEIKKFRLKKNRIKLKIAFSKEQKAASEDFLAPDIIQGKKMPYGTSLFIDNPTSWLFPPTTSFIIVNNAGDTTEAGLGMMDIFWDNVGTKSLFSANAANNRIRLKNGSETSDSLSGIDCNSQIMSSNNGNPYDLGAQIKFGGLHIDTWLAQTPVIETNSISKNFGGEWMSHDQFPMTGSTTVGNYKYPWTVRYMDYEFCPEHFANEQITWQITYHKPVPL